MRFTALDQAQQRKATKLNYNAEEIKSLFGSNVFGKDAQKNYLSKEAYLAIGEAMESGKVIDRNIAGHIAAGMKRWALSNGATHYTHWFQPLTGSTAEKHDSFFEPDNGKAIEKFTADSLVQQEPDASSLPSGGLRNTFEARGYTAWDPSSPAFIFENTSGKTLCIPTIFVSYTGESLDYKAPLLKSLSLLDKSATEVCQYFDKNTNKVTASLGVEQEYFLVDESLFYARPDLVLAGRSVLGLAPPKGQQMDDHYFGSIPDRVFNYMYDLEIEALKLGIPLKTRHNEVAPGQYECAPMFEEVNLAVDHNQLLMDLMTEVASRHGFKVLFHEKPFAGINGSGKHNNWSLITNTGVNLLSPGNDPDKDLQFLTFFINTIKTFHDNADLIRASIASAGNDHRLGANEAPPAIMSIFIGSTLTQVLNDFESSKQQKGKKNVEKTINIAKIPEILPDNTDRNRTSPFAFTGNKFELRAVGSSENCASPMTTLNSGMAKQLMEFKIAVDDRIKKGEKKQAAIISELKTILKDSKKILFEGNGYGIEWEREAKKRGLSNLKTTPEALNAYLSKQAEKTFVETGVFTKQELEARVEIWREIYIKKVQIEGRVMSELARSYILPAVSRYQNQLAQTIVNAKNAGVNEKFLSKQTAVLNLLSEHLEEFVSKVDEMNNNRKKANSIENTENKAEEYCKKVIGLFDAIRIHSDKLEKYADNAEWPIPKYRELLFIK